MKSTQVGTEILTADEKKRRENRRAERDWEKKQTEIQRAYDRLQQELATKGKDNPVVVH